MLAPLNKTEENELQCYLGHKQNLVEPLKVDDASLERAAE
jgi:hypothetical protein